MTGDPDPHGPIRDIGNAGAVHRDFREAMFRLRYAIEQTGAALRTFITAHRQAVEHELAARKAAAGRLAQRRAADKERLEADYQEWKRQLEERTL